MRFTFVAPLILSFASVAHAVTDTASMQVKVFGIYVSTSALCDNPVAICTTQKPNYVDVVSGPTICAGTVTDGTYQCIIYKISDVIKFKAREDTTNCSASTEVAQDLCTAIPPGCTSTALDGTTISGTGSSRVGDGISEDQIYVYLTTNTTADGGVSGNPFGKPTATGADGIKLSSPIVITDGGIGNLIINGLGKVDPGSAPCQMNSPIFGYR